MISVCLLLSPRLSATGWDHFEDDLRIVGNSATACGVRREQDPGRADFVLVIGARLPLQADVRRLPALRSAGRRAYIYDSSDSPVPMLPGIYPAIPRSRFRPRWTRSGPYLRWIDRGPTAPAGRLPPARWLFSFVGAADTHPLRKHLLALRTPSCFLRDTSDDAGRSGGQTEAVYAAYRAQYETSLAESLFVLCPRGAGVSSLRVFETMRAGRVPVVISDEWVPPIGPDWNAVSLRVAEAEIDSIPEQLEARRGEAMEMGRAARAAWERYFSPDTVLSTFVVSLQELAAVRSRFEAPERVRALAEWVGRRSAAAARRAKRKLSGW